MTRFGLQLKISSPIVSKRILALNCLANANEIVITTTVNKLNEQDTNCTLLKAVLIQNVLNSRLHDKENGIVPSKQMIEESVFISAKNGSVAQSKSVTEHEYVSRFDNSLKSSFKENQLSDSEFCEEFDRDDQYEDDGDDFDQLDEDRVEKVSKLASSKISVSFPKKRKSSENAFDYSVTLT